MPASAGSWKKKKRQFQKNIHFCFIDYTKAFDCIDHNKLWKTLQEMGISDHFTCLLENLHAHQKSTASIWWIIKKQESSRKISICFIDYAKAFDCVDHNKLWKILKEMGIPDHLTCLLRNLYAGKEATVRTGHETTDSSNEEKEYVKAVYCHPSDLTYIKSTS